MIVLSNPQLREIGGSWISQGYKSESATGLQSLLVTTQEIPNHP